MILPDRVLGRSSVKTTVFGRAMGPILAATWLAELLALVVAWLLARPAG